MSLFYKEAFTYIYACVDHSTALASPVSELYHLQYPDFYELFSCRFGDKFSQFVTENFLLHLSF